MTNHCADRLLAACERTQSLACVGLDPRVGLLPEAVRQQALAAAGGGREGVCAAFQAFNRGIISAVAGRCPVIKPQVACYEAYGSAGMAVLEDTIATARAAGLEVIADGKRNDIGSTATHYREAWLSGPPGLDEECVLAGAGADWLTVNGYLGADGVRPMLDDPPGAHGVFVLVKTSNPGSAELQGQPSGEGSVMEVMARLVAGWGHDRLGQCGLSDIGAVVGATWPDEARRLREIMPETLFLVPGYGAQGGSAADALAGLRSQGDGVIINASRSIIGAGCGLDPAADWREAIAAALEAMNADIASAR